MNVIQRNPDEERVLLLTPTGRDAELISRLLTRAGCQVFICEHACALCDEIERGASAVVLAEEGLRYDSLAHLTKSLDSQPAWSDLPLIVLTMVGKTTRYSAMLAEVLKAKVNHTFLERPLRMLTLVSSVRVAQRSRARQYEMRDLLAATADEVRKRDQFIAMLGHELRNPLAAIRASVDILNHFGCDDPSLISAQGEVIDRQSRNMARLVDDLLDVARLTSGRLHLTKARFDLRDSVRRSVEAMRLGAADHAHRLHVDLPASPVVVDGDSMRLEQVFGNLLSNSIRYSPDGGEIAVKLEVQEEFATITFKDDGDGIEPHLLPKIFEPFVQADQTLARQRGGLGLGLAVVQNIVNLHGGSVAVASDGKNSGSEFTVRLPVVARKRAPAPREPSAAQAVDLMKRVLVVEDNADARQSLAMLLRLLKHEVYEADTGTSGLSTLLEVRPDIALIDIGLPELSGYDVASRARTALGNDTYMIALTGYGQAEDRERAAVAGFDAHLVKPIDVKQIKTALSRAGEFQAGVGDHDGESA